MIRTLGESAPRVLLIALNDATADGKDVSWIWDVDLEPLLAGAQTMIASGDRAAELAVRLLLRQSRALGTGRRAGPRTRARPGLALVPPGGELPVLPTYTAMLAARHRRAAQARHPYWEQTPV